MFFQDEVEQTLVENEIIPSLDGLEEDWNTYVQAILAEATLTIPSNKWKQSGGRLGKHTEHLGMLLTELQYMQRTYPNMQW